MPRKRGIRNSSKAKASNLVTKIPQRGTGSEADLRLEIKNAYQRCGFQNDKQAVKSHSKTQQQPKYWASGTGFGNDSMTGTEWNISAYIESQSKQSDAVQTTLTKIKKLLFDLKPVKTLAEDTEREIEKSLIPVMEYYLFDVSFLDIEQFGARYVTSVEILELLASWAQLQHVLLPQKDRPKCIYNTIKSLKSQTKIMALENKKKDESSDFLLDFTKKVNHLYDLLKEVKKRPPPPSNSTDTVTDSTPSSHASVAKQKPASLLQKVWKLITVPCQRCLKKKKLAELQKETAKDSSSVQKEVLQTSTSNTENTKITESNIKDKGTENKTKKEQDAETNKKDEEKRKSKRK